MLFIKEQKQMIIIAAGAAILAGFFIFRYLPLQSKLSRLEQKQAEQSLIIKKAQLKSKELSRLKDKKEQLESLVGDFNRKVPSEKKLGSFLQRITGLMDAHNLKGQVIEPGNQKVENDLNCILINMKCRGGLEEIYDFFASLQRLDRAIRIQQVRLKNNDGYSGNVNMSTEAVVYSTAGKEKG